MQTIDPYLPSAAKFAVMHNAAFPTHVVVGCNPWIEGSTHEAARVHHTSRRRSSHLAAHGARAASDAGDWVYGREHGLQPRPTGRRFRAAATRTRLGRGAQRGNRISLGGGPQRTHSEIAAEFVRLKVDIIVTHANALVTAAKQATSIIPIVFGAVGDPVGAGCREPCAAGRQRYGTFASTDGSPVSDSNYCERLSANVGNATTVLEMANVQTTARALGIEVATAKIQRAADSALARTRNANWPRECRITEL